VKERETLLQLTMLYIDWTTLSRSYSQSLKVIKVNFGISGRLITVNHLNHLSIQPVNTDFILSYMCTYLFSLRKCLRFICTYNGDTSTVRLAKQHYYMNTE